LDGIKCNLNVSITLFPLHYSFVIIGVMIILTFAYLGLNKIRAEIEEIEEYQIPMNTLITE